MRIPFLLLLAASLATPAAAEDPSRSEPVLPGGVARLVLPGEGVAAAPLALLLPDATGDQGRSEAYVAALAARGVASLVLGLEDAADGAQPLPPTPGREAVAQALAWAEGQAPLLLGHRIAVIGIGAGARVALAAEGAPVVALDPGCAGLRLPAGRPMLLVHGLAARDAAACAALEGTPGLDRLALPGVGHGWDLPVVAAPGGAMLPDPSGPGRRRAAPDPVATEAVAAIVADWVSLRLVGPRP